MRRLMLEMRQTALGDAMPRHVHLEAARRTLIDADFQPASRQLLAGSGAG
jgi:hypothetical protein